MKFTEIFDLNENGLFECKICHTTFNKPDECGRHFHISEVNVGDDDE
jgi:hypothetical protein